MREFQESFLILPTIIYIIEILLGSKDVSVYQQDIGGARKKLHWNRKLDFHHLDCGIFQGNLDKIFSS